MAALLEECAATNVAKTAGVTEPRLSFGAFFDFYLGTGNPDLSTLVPNRMFRNAEGHQFQDVTTAGNFGHLQKGHAICFGDLDNDGDQDIFSSMGGAFTADKAYSYENPGNRNSWLSLCSFARRHSPDAWGYDRRYSTCTQRILIRASSMPQSR